MKKLISFRDITVCRDGGKLIIANSRIRRVFDFSQGAPRTISLQSACGKELASGKNPECDLSFIGLTRPGSAEQPWTLRELSCRIAAKDIYEPERVIVTAVMEESSGKTEYVRDCIIYPELAALAVETSIRTQVVPNVFWLHRRTIPNPGAGESSADSLLPAKGVRVVKSVEFRGRTDVEDTPVYEHRSEAAEMTGNLLYCSAADGSGFIFLQEAPPSGERRDFELYDFRIDPETGVVHSCSWGIAPDDFRDGRKTYRSYRHVLLVHDTEAEREMVLKQYLKRRFDQSAFHSVTVNPWGCGQFPKLVSPKFLKAECRAAAECGATHYQFDDGWQNGRGLGEMNVKNKHITPDFWGLRKNLTRHFEDIIHLCGKLGLRSALWFAPSNNVEYRDWRSSAEILLDFHRRYGISCFKIDAVKIRSYEAESNLRSLFHYVRRASKGKVFFNLDTTSGQRPGYFQFLEFGNIFLENRYVFLPPGWVPRYHPDKTLRALWLLAHYTRTQSLQIEVPYPGNAVNPNVPDKLPVRPPSLDYPLEYWAAVALFANPLLWFAPSQVTVAERRRYRKIMELHRSIREPLFAGEIFPLGDEPDGKHISGFYSTSGFAVFYRGLKAVKTKKTFPQLKDWECEKLGGSGSLIRGELVMPEKASFVLFRKKN